MLKYIDIQSRIILCFASCLLAICVSFGIYRAINLEYEKVAVLLVSAVFSSSVIGLILSGKENYGRRVFVLLVFTLLTTITHRFGYQEIFWQFPGVVAMTFALRGYKEVVFVAGVLLVSNSIILSEKHTGEFVISYAASQLSLIIMCGLVIELLKSQIIATESEADTDALTGLSNRNSFDKYLKNNSSYGSVLLLVDVDHFKQVNDSYGHAIGDRVLKSIAQKMKIAVRKNDYTFRYGGEEFAIILPNTTMLSARVIAERVRTGIGSLAITIDANKVISCTASIGMAPKKELNDRDWISECDHYLYEAKNGGRNCVRYSLKDLY